LSLVRRSRKTSMSNLLDSYLLKSSPRNAGGKWRIRRQKIRRDHLDAKWAKGKTRRFRSGEGNYVRLIQRRCKYPDGDGAELIRTGTWTNRSTRSLRSRVAVASSPGFSSERADGAVCAETTNVKSFEVSSVRLTNSGNSSDERPQNNNEITSARQKRCRR
jgi:hypothetical protein